MRQRFRFDLRARARRGRLFFRRQVRGATGRSRAALRQWGGADNPFLGRALRVETRNGQPLRLALIVGFVLLCVNFGFWRMSGLYSGDLFGTNAPSMDGSSGGLLPAQLPDALGGNFIGYAALAAAATCACAALLMSRVRVSSLLRREQLQGTLEQLQLLPIAAERWLWLAGAPGVVWAMLIGLLGLPLFALAVWTQQWSVWDVLGLFLVFLWLGHVAPSAIVPTASSTSRSGTKASSASGATTGANNPQSSTRSGEASGAHASGASAGMTSAGMTSADAANVAARTLRGAQSETLIFSVLVIGLFQFALWTVRAVIFTLGGGAKTMRLVGLPDSVVGLLPALPLTWPLFVARLVVTPLPFFALSLPPVLLLLPWLIGRRRRAYLALANQVDAPSKAVRLRRERRRSRLGRSVNWLGWIMVVGYGWHPLMTLGVPALLLHGTSPAIATSTAGSSTPAWARAALWTAILILAALYAWSGILDAFRPDQKSLRAKTVAAFKAANVQASEVQNLEANEAAQQQPAQQQPAEATRKVADESSTRLSGRITGRQWRAAFKAIGVNLGAGVACYFVLCWLGGTSGLDAVWRERLWPTTATVLAFLVAVLGAAAMGAALPEKPWKLRTRWRKIAWLWFGGLLLVALAFHFYDQLNTNAPSKSFEFEQAPYVVFSPLVSLLSLLRFSLSRPGVIWQSGPIAQAVVGLALIALSFPVSQLQLRAMGEDRPGLLRRLWRLLMRGLGALLRGVWRVLVFLFAPIFRFIRDNYGRPFRKLYATIERGVNFLVDWGEGLGNPVLDVALHRPAKATTTSTKKTPQHLTPQKSKVSRSAALRQSWSMSCAGCLFLQTAVFVLITFLSLTSFLTTLPTMAPWTFVSGWPVNPALQSFGQGLVALAIGVSLAIVLLGTGSLGNALDRDRTNGTLIFLFLTPLSDGEILGGKLLFPLLGVLPFLATALPWLGLGTLVAFAGGDYAMPIVALLSLLLVLSILAFALCWQTRGAARATKTGTGASSATGLVLLVECVVCGLLLAAFGNGRVWFCLALVAISALHLALAHLGWKQALKALNRKRFSDDATRGTVSN